VEHDDQQDCQPAQSFDVWPEASPRISPRFDQMLLAAVWAPSPRTADAAQFDVAGSVLE
jgi:hypothetical protein